MDIITLVIGIALGAVIGYLIGKVLKPGEETLEKDEKSISIDRYNDLQNHLNTIQQEKNNAEIVAKLKKKENIK